MSRLNPEVFDYHRCHAAALRASARRHWKPLAWLLRRLRALLRCVACNATKYDVQR